MIFADRTYTAKNGKKFRILARKQKHSSNGCDYVGECTESGLIAFFNYKGRHSHDASYDLHCDRYKWVPIAGGGQIAVSKFLAADNFIDDVDSYAGFLRMENDSFSSICFQTVAQFKSFYA